MCNLFSGKTAKTNYELDVELFKEVNPAVNILLYMSNNQY